jgi:hypothetical protein
MLGALTLALAAGGCGDDALDATTRARVYGCLDRAPQNVRTLPARGYVLDGLGCDDLKPDDVRAALPTWRAERAASNARASRG